MRKRTTKVLSIIFTLFLGSSIATQNINAFDFSKYLRPENELASRNNVGDRYIIEVSPQNRSRVEGLIKKYQGNLDIKHEFTKVFNGFSVDLTPSTVTKLSTSGLVKKIHKTRIYYPLMKTAGAITHSVEAKNKYNDGSGTVISIIDSGIDTTHKNLSTLPDESKAKIKDIQSSDETNFTIKVPKGHNFIDGNDIVKDTTTSMHGMHVSGIAGAYTTSDDGINGIAPGAQLLAMKVFSNYEDANPESNIRKGAQDDDIIAAIEESVKDKADIINMSLGSDNGFNDPGEPMISAINKANEAGSLVVVAAGNSSTATGASSSGDVATNKMHKTDIGLIGNPAVATGALSVASFENTTLLKDTAYLKNLPTNESILYELAHGDLVTGEHPYEYVNLGKEDDYNGKDVQDKFVLIQRGDISFAEKATRAKEKGALGAIIFNNVEGTVGMAGLDPLGNYMVISLTKSEGEKLVSANDKIISFTTDKHAIPNPASNKMSTFTSWGTTNELDFKPEITGVGGNVYSTVNDNKYGTMSGTSMATPHVSGASAIIINEVRKNLGLDGNKLVEYVKQTMMNTADIVVDAVHGNLPYSPRQQGAGLINTVNAIENRVTITDSSTNKAAGELKEFETSKELKLTFTNYSDSIKKYKFNSEKTSILTQATNDKNEVLATKADGNISLNENEFTIEPKSTKEITLTISTNKVLNNFVEGYVYFDSLDNSPNLHFSYMGFSGNWSDEESIVEYNKEVDPDTEFKLPPFLSTIKLPFSSSILNLGEDFDKNMDVEAMSFSPNGDNIADEIIPQPTIIRNLDSISYDIVTKDNDNEKPVIHLADEKLVRRINFKTYNNAANKNLLNPVINATWDGKVFNQQNGEMEQAKDGKYYYKLTYKVRKTSNPKTIYIPFTVDTVKPVIKPIVHQDGKNYIDGDNERIFYFDVEDANKIMKVTAKFNGKDIEVEEADKDEPGAYRISLPFTTNATDKLEISAVDYAYNEAISDVKFKNENMNISLPRYIDTKIRNSFDSKLIPTGKLPEGITKFEVELTKVGTEETVTKTYNVQKNGVIRSAFDGIVLTKQGKYDVIFNLYTEDGTLNKTLEYGQIAYDYLAPTVEFTNAISQDKTAKSLSELIGGKDVDDYGLGKTKAYKVEVPRSMPSGKVTIEGIVKDEVNKPNEVIFTQGKNIQKVNVSEDGHFTYTYDSNSPFEFFNIKDPDMDSTATSETLDALDLATSVPTEKKTGKNRTYLMTYKDVQDTEDPSKDNAQEKKTVTIDTPSGDLDVYLGYDAKQESEKENNQYKLYKKDDGWYYKVSGVANFKDATVFINGEQLSGDDVKNTAIGTAFSKLVKIDEKKNLISYKVLDTDGNVVQAAALKVYFDITEPELNIDVDNAELIDSDIANIDKVIRTDANELKLSITASDNGSGYILTVNGDDVKSIDDTINWGNNKNVLEYIVKVPENTDDDNDSIIAINLNDQFGNSITKRFIVVRRETQGNFDKDKYNYYRDKPSNIDAKTGFLDFEILNVELDDNTLVLKTDYTLKNGIVTLNKEFIDKLSDGEHIMKVKTKYQTITSKLVVQEKQETKPDSKKTRQDLIDELKDLFGDKTDNVDIPHPPVVPKEEYTEEQPEYTTDENITTQNNSSNNSNITKSMNPNKSNSTKEKDSSINNESKNKDNSIDKSKESNKQKSSDNNKKSETNKEDTTNKNQENTTSTIPWLYIIPIALLIILLLLLLLFIRNRKDN